MINSKRIVVFIPKDSNTGGPECLHQFVNTARALHFPVFIAYYTGKLKIERESYVNSNYSKYFTVGSMSDSQTTEILPQDYLIIPEVEVAHLAPYQQHPMAIWWLSIDNAVGPVRLFMQRNWGYRFYAGMLATLFRCRLIDNPTRLRLLYPMIASNFALHRYQHFCQSYYAYQFFDGILPHRSLLGDFTDLPLEDLKETTYTKENQVLYNPKKGFHIMEWFIQRYPEISWIPIQNMTKQEVMVLMQCSMVYVDFGNHPGKDRIPREASLCGCIVITNREGSAAHFEDVGLSDAYKFANPIAEHATIITLIQDIFSNYPKHRELQISYTETIQNEPNTFAEQVSRILRSVLE